MEVLNEERRNKLEETKRTSTDEKHTSWMHLGFLGHCISFSKKAEQHHGGAKPHGHGHGHSHGHHEEHRAKNSAGRDRSVSPLDSSPSPRHAKSTSPSPSNIGLGFDISSHLRHFSFNELKHATRNFKDEAVLGSGGFGRVYKGWVNPVGVSPVKPGTGLAVAVKTLNHGGRQGHREWLAEINYLSKLHHPNLVTLVGFCIEGDKRLLVYEFMACGSLDKHLFRRGYPLPWSKRIKIALDAAKGLAFLHEEAENPVIYRDFKASNILLDGDFNAKLSDFGLAKDGPEGDKSHVSTRVMGTYGYAAPEYVRTGHLTSRSDIYSFGIVLLEMLSGRKSVDRHRPTGNQKLLDWALPYLRDKQQYLSVIDPQLQNCYPIQGARIAVQLAARCISHDPRARPLMSEVVRVLQPISEVTDYQHSTAFPRSLNSPLTQSQPQSPRTPSELPTLPVLPRPSPQTPPPESQSPPA